MSTPTLQPHIRRLGAILAALAFFLFPFFPVLGAAEAPERPDIMSFPESSVLLCQSSDPDNAIAGLEKAPEERTYPASVTKILTALVALENSSLADLVTISAHAVDLSRVNSKIGAQEGEIYTMEDLLYGMLLPSGCDAARAIAEHVARSEEKFAVLMNTKAAELGMENSHFSNASGLHDSNQYTTARDLARLGVAAAENDALCTILQTPSRELKEQTTGRLLQVKNINRLVSDPTPSEEYEKITALYPWCIGGKTGSTNAAGRTYLAMARKNDVTLICVLLGDKVSTRGLSGAAYDAVSANRFLEAVSLFTYGFDYLYPESTMDALAARGLPHVFTAQTQDGDCLRLLTCRPVSPEGAVSLPREAYIHPETIEAKTELVPLSLPIKAGQRIGTVTYSFQGEILFSCPLEAESDLLPSPTATPVPQIQVDSRPATTAVPVQEDTSSHSSGLLRFLPLCLLLLGGGLYIVLRKRK